MAHHKRCRPKDRRSGCLFCKPFKSNGAKDKLCNQTEQEKKGILSEDEQVKEFVVASDSMNWYWGSKSTISTYLDYVDGVYDYDDTDSEIKAEEEAMELDKKGGGMILVDENWAKNRATMAGLTHHLNLKG